MHFFVQLCRQNDQFDNFKVFCAFESSIKAFGNIFRNTVFLMNSFLMKFIILHLNWKCAKWVEITDYKMDLTCSVGYSLVVHVQKDAFLVSV